MEMSNVERIRLFSASFEAAVGIERFVPPAERWDDIPSASEIATQMKAFGESISHNTELYYGSFLKRVSACFEKIADEPKASAARAIFESIPGFELHAQ